jgi:hypothetical protein
VYANVPAKLRGGLACTGWPQRSLKAVNTTLLFQARSCPVAAQNGGTASHQKLLSVAAQREVASHQRILFCRSTKGEVASHQRILFRRGA